MTIKQWHSGWFLYIWIVAILNFTCIFLFDDTHLKIWAGYMAVVHLPVMLTVIISEYLEDRKRWKRTECYQIDL